jgi:hypothetical protein
MTRSNKFAAASCEQFGFPILGTLRVGKGAPPGMRRFSSMHWTNDMGA